MWNHYKTMKSNKKRACKCKNVCSFNPVPFRKWIQLSFNLQNNAKLPVSWTMSIPPNGQMLLWAQNQPITQSQQNLPLHPWKLTAETWKYHQQDKRNIYKPPIFGFHSMLVSIMIVFGGVEKQTLNKNRHQVAIKKEFHKPLLAKPMYFCVCIIIVEAIWQEHVWRKNMSVVLKLEHLWWFNKKRAKKKSHQHWWFDSDFPWKHFQASSDYMCVQNTRTPVQ